MYVHMHIERVAHLIQFPVPYHHHLFTTLDCVSIAPFVCLTLPSLNVVIYVSQIRNTPIYCLGRPESTLLIRHGDYSYNLVEHAAYLLL